MSSDLSVWNSETARRRGRQSADAATRWNETTGKLGSARSDVDDDENINRWLRRDQTVNERPDRLQSLTDGDGDGTAQRTGRNTLHPSRSLPCTSFFFEVDLGLSRRQPITLHAFTKLSSHRTYMPSCQVLMMHLNPLMTH